MNTIVPANLSMPMQTVTGPGSIERLLPMALAFGKRGALVCGRSMERSGVVARIMAACPDKRAVIVWRHSGGEPDLDQLDELLTAVRGHDAGWIAAVGGGSVLDLAKAAAGLLEAPLETRTYHDGQPLPPSKIPFLAAPTTAGTGSEATAVAVLTNTAKRIKKSIRHPSFMARHVVLDPDLLAHCPAHVVACAGMDALTQAMESYVSRGATWWTDTMALKAMERVAVALPAVYAGGSDADRQNLLIGSYLAGLALANARLGIVHGLAHPLGAHFQQPHGLVCAVCLPLALAFNREAIADKREAMDNALGGNTETVVADLIRRLDISSPFDKCVMMPDLQKTMVAEVLASGSTKANPRPVGKDDARRLLRAVMTKEVQS